MYLKFEGKGVKSDIKIMDCGQNYEWLLIGSEDRKQAWILSRDPYMDK